MATGTTVKLVVPSEIRLIDLVHAMAEKMAEVVGFNADDTLDVGLAVREAAINAMAHGNREDPTLDVTVVITVGDGILEARVIDQGPGFDPTTTADPTDAAHVLETSGRGLLLINAFVDEVQFNKPANGGMEITMTKKRSEEKE